MNKEIAAAKIAACSVRSEKRRRRRATAPPRAPSRRALGALQTTTRSASHPRVAHVATLEDDVDDLSPIANSRRRNASGRQWGGKSAAREYVPPARLSEREEATRSSDPWCSIDAVDSRYIIRRALLVL